MQYEHTKYHDAAQMTQKTTIVVACMCVCVCVLDTEGGGHTFTTQYGMPILRHSAGRKMTI